MEIIVPEKHYRIMVEQWLESLDESPLKSAIIRIHWRELKPPRDWFRLTVITSHRFQDEVNRFLEAGRKADEEAADEASERLLSRHGAWIDSFETPKEAILDERTAEIDWWPEGLPYHDPDSLPPQERAQHELESQAADFLFLCHVSALPSELFVQEFVGSNTPFFSAGSILGPGARLVRHFPSDFPNSETAKERLHDHFFDHPADFIVFMRMAHHYGSRLGLVCRALATRDAFLRQNKHNLSKWLNAYRLTICEDESHAILDVAWDAVLDQACEYYRAEIIEALRGHESELPEALNSFLPKLPIAEDPFAAELREESDWSKSTD